jgi:hypothetical protein
MRNVEGRDRAGLQQPACLELRRQDGYVPLLRLKAVMAYACDRPCAWDPFSGSAIVPQCRQVGKASAEGAKS